MIKMPTSTTPKRNNKYLEENLKELYSDYKRNILLSFKYIESIKNINISERQFKMFSANYFYRTLSTPAAVSSVITCLLSSYPPNITIAKKILLENLTDEIGRSDKEHNHLTLLLDSINIVRSKVFRLGEISMNDLLESPLIIQESRQFRENQLRLYGSRIEPIVLGASYAQESCATKMLEAIHHGIFKPLFQNLKDKEIAIIERYFNAHLCDSNGAREKAHSETARMALLKYCD
ncbi:MULTISPECIES: iron-containing redox enzyme family protein [Methylomonas]|uniref:iron-containing redox enzyme family protein n=1 Tax=Methylomonas TaxID=416 RepID=UPI000B022916|nr:iron-containing redox enzyme family protein [Methylomonas koyamae]